MKTILLIPTLLVLLTVRQGAAQEVLPPEPLGQPGSDLSTLSPDTTPATGPAQTGGETTAFSREDQSGVTGGVGEEFPTSTGTGFPSAGTTMEQSGQGTGTGSTTGGSGTGTGGLGGLDRPS